MPEICLRFGHSQDCKDCQIPVMVYEGVTCALQLKIFQMQNKIMSKKYISVKIGKSQAYLRDI